MRTSCCREPSSSGLVRTIDASREKRGAQDITRSGAAVGECAEYPGLEERTMTHATSRRDFLALLAALPAAGLAADAALAQAAMPSRRIPGYSESLPVIGLGSSKVVEESAKQGEGPLREV